MLTGVQEHAEDLDDLAAAPEEEIVFEDEQDLEEVVVDEEDEEDSRYPTRDREPADDLFVSYSGSFDKEGSYLNRATYNKKQARMWAEHAKFCMQHSKRRQFPRLNQPTHAGLNAQLRKPMRQSNLMWIADSALK